MTDERFIALVQQYRLQQLSPQEHTEFMGAIKSGQYDHLLKDTIIRDLKDAPRDIEWTPTYEQELLQTIIPKKQPRIWLRYAAAVIILVGLTTFFLNKKDPQPTETTLSKEQDIAPGQNGAILTLSDGTKMVLDTMHDAVIAQQNGSQVVLKDGQLAYRPTSNAEAAITYNTMSTPKGRQFKITLPDGSQAWLNSASSIRYPTLFTGKERNVEMTGEVYFEVAHNTKMPFHVSINHKAAIQVLGTHFNIKAYEEETTKATLLEGSVRFSVNDQMQVLEPGQQAQLIDGAISVANGTDINQVMAWKNGLFNFKGYDIRSMMNEIARWYDLDIVYETEPRARKFAGEMQRNFTLSQTMLTLKKLKINYKLEGRTLTITAP